MSMLSDERCYVSEGYESDDGLIYIGVQCVYAVNLCFMLLAQYPKTVPLESHSRTAEPDQVQRILKPIVQYFSK